MSSGTPDLSAAPFHPVLREADAALRRGDWPGVRTAFAAASSAYEQHLIVAAARSVTGCENLLTVLCGRDASDLLARTMLASRQVGQAWEARGSGRADTVGRDQFATFFAFLEQAEQSLIEVCAREPRFVPAWGVRLVTSRGLELGRSETRRRYQRLSEHSAHDLLAQEQVLQDLLPKWGGSWEQAGGFVWECANQAPPGSPNASLVVVFHIERWVDGDVDLQAVFADPAVRRDVWQAGEQSVMHPAFGAAPGWEYALSTFALGYSLIEDWPRAKSCFARLGPHLQDAGWSYFDKPAEVFAQWQRQAMAS